MQLSTPSEWQTITPINIGITAGIETDKISSQWVQKCNTVQKIIVPSEHAKMGFHHTSYQAEDQFGNDLEIKCRTPIDVIPYPVRIFDKDEKN